jgi:hypothetical protein
MAVKLTRTKKDHQYYCIGLRYTYTDSSGHTWEIHKDEDTPPSYFGHWYIGSIISGHFFHNLKEVRRWLAGKEADCAVRRTNELLSKIDYDEIEKEAEASLSKSKPIHIPGTPGTFEMDDATEENAIANMEQFIQDCQCSDDLAFERSNTLDYHGGRYAFMVSRKGFRNRFEIQMPGRELDRVRYTGAEDQNIWHYPRLYVDGSSWVWKYAIIKDENWPRTCPECGCADSDCSDQALGTWHCWECDADFTPPVR